MAHESTSPTAGVRGRPLDGILVVALEQAVAAPYCSSRLADAGARVIKIERPEGDFARGYDVAVHGLSSYFVWINRGKESIALDLKQADQLAIVERMIASADVFIQNLAPGAAARLGLGSPALRDRHRRLITCDVSGYGEDGPARGLKAYDLLVQAESGLVSVNGAPGEWGRIGVSLCDICAGMNAVIGIQQALLQRHNTGCGSGVSVSLFGTAAELMAVPYLQTRYGGRAPQRVGLKHPSVAPYGVFRCADGRDILISIQNEREWVRFCKEFLGDPAFGADPRFASNQARCENRSLLDDRIQREFGAVSSDQALDRLRRADTAYGSVNSVKDLIDHPQLRTTPMPIGDRSAQLPAVPYHSPWNPSAFAPAPTLDEHGALLRREFAGDREAKPVPLAPGLNARAGDD